MSGKISKETLNPFHLGMDCDTDISLMEKGKYLYAKNLRTVNDSTSGSGAKSPIEFAKTIKSNSFNGETVVHTNSSNDISVVFTTKNGSTNIYVVSYSLQLDVFKSVTIQSYAPTALSSIIRYEDDYNIRVYFADGVNQIMCAPIVKLGESKTYTSPGHLYIVPESYPGKPIIDSIGNGNLLAGRIQYFYQSYNETGSSSVLSNPSAIVDLSTINGDGGKITDTYGEVVGRSVRIKIPMSLISSFIGVKIYSVYYYNYGANPVIKLISDVKILDKNSTYLYHTDYGTLTLSELTLDEFLLLSSNIFSAKNIETKDNMLFASNVQEKDFDIVYDTRSYQFNLGTSSEPQSILYTSDLIEENKITIKRSQLSSFDTLVPSAHDCINKDIYQSDKYSDIIYKYNIDGNLGGTGKNVDYVFTNTMLVGAKEGTRKADYVTNIGAKFIDDRIVRLGAKNTDISNLLMQNSDGNNEYVDITKFGIQHHNGRLDYSNPLLSFQLASYKRDEIYRFAAILHSTDGRKTKAKWIADIRFPNLTYGDMGNIGAWSSDVFEMPEDAFVNDYKVGGATDAYLYSQELIIKPLGLKFTFKNIPAGVTKIEILRAKRDLSNRTILGQGVLQKLGTFKNQKETENNWYATINYNDTANEGSLRPHPIISMGYSYAIAPIMIGTKYFMSGNLDPVNTGDGTTMNFNQYVYSDGLKPVENSSAYSPAPYFSRNDSFMYISPDISYYKDEILSSIKNKSSYSYLSISNIIYPKVTNAVKSLSSVGNSSYIGRDDHNRLRFKYSGNAYPTAMYSVADLTEDLVNLEEENGGVSEFGMMFTAGLTGSTKEGNIGLNTECGDLDSTTGTSLDTRRYDIFPGSTSETAKEAGVYGKLFISGFGLLYCTSYLTDSAPLDVDCHYRSAISINACETGAESEEYDIHKLSHSNAYLEELRHQYIDAGFGSITFKYYNSFRKRKAGAMQTDSDSTDYQFFTLLYQNSTSLQDYTETTLSYPYSIPNVNIKDVALARDESTAIPHNKFVSSSIIGGMQYMNYSKPFGNFFYRTETVDGIEKDKQDRMIHMTKARMAGLHGEGLLINVEAGTLPSILSMSIRKKKFFDGTSESNHRPLENRIASGLGTFVVDIKTRNNGIYGGPSYEDRQFTEYVSTGIFAENTSPVYVFSGDTYISMFDYTITHALDQVDGSDGVFKGIGEIGNVYNDIALSQTMRVGAIIPIESNINTMLDSGNTYTKNHNVLTQALAGTYSIAAGAGLDYVRSQSRNEHDYNAAYSSEMLAAPGFSSIMSEKTNQMYPHRIVSSEKKSNGELYDSWSEFKSANYIDVDNKYGEITHLKYFRDKLYFIQEHGIGIVSVNERSLITDGDGSELSLGTGTVLARYDYLSTMYGLSKLTPKAIYSNQNSIYLFDSSINSILQVADSVVELSKAKSVQSYMNGSINTISPTFTIGENKKYNEILFSSKYIKDNYEYSNK